MTRIELRSNDTVMSVMVGPTTRVAAGVNLDEKTDRAYPYVVEARGLTEGEDWALLCKTEDESRRLYRRALAAIREEEAKR